MIATILGVVAGRSAAAPTLLVAPLASQGTEDARLSRVFTEDLRAQIGSTYPRRIAVAGDAAGRPRRPGLRRAYELGGSLRTSGRTVRVAIHMADAGSGIQLWSDVIECDVAHLTAIERKIAQRIGHELGIDAALVEPTAQAAGSASRKRQQIALAELEISRGVGSGEPAAFARAIAAAHEALHADYGSAAAHSALAWAELHRGNLARAERELRLAIALDPHDRLARQRLGVVLARR